MRVFKQTGKRFGPSENRLRICPRRGSRSAIWSVPATKRQQYGYLPCICRETLTRIGSKGTEDDGAYRQVLLGERQPDLFRSQDGVAGTCRLGYFGLGHSLPEAPAAEIHH